MINIETIQACREVMICITLIYHCVLGLPYPLSRRILENSSNASKEYSVEQIRMMREEKEKSELKRKRKEEQTLKQREKYIVLKEKY